MRRDRIWRLPHAHCSHYSIRNECMCKECAMTAKAQTGTGHIHSINISPGGVPKLPIKEAVITPLGIEGDGHNDWRNHGGPNAALCLFTLETIQRLQAEGHPIFPGSVGENITLEGIEHAALT